MSDSCSLSPPLSWIRSNRITVRDFSPHSNDGIWVTILCSSLPDAYYALASVCQIRVGLRKGKAIKHHETRCHMMCRSAGISISKSFPKACLQTRNVSVFQGGWLLCFVIVGHCCCLFVPLYYFQHRWHKYFVFFDVWSIKPTAAHVIENDGIFLFFPMNCFTVLQPFTASTALEFRIFPEWPQQIRGGYSWPLMAGMPTIYQLDVWGNQPWVF